MRVSEVFDGVGAGFAPGFGEALWAQLSADPVARVDAGRRGGNLVIDIEFALGVDPRQVAVRHEDAELVLVHTVDHEVLYRLPLDAPVVRPSVRRGPNGLSVTAPLAGPAPVPVSPGLRTASRTRRLRAALAAFGDRVRSLLSR
ncbi:hypothetical protein [Nocardiopsis oceani]